MTLHEKLQALSYFEAAADTVTGATSSTLHGHHEEGHILQIRCANEVTSLLSVLRRDGSGEDWLCWRAINRLRTGVGRAKTTMRRWGYLDDAQSVDCDCGEPQTMAHLLSCRLLDEACTADDLATVTERAKACARKWENIV